MTAIIDIDGNDITLFKDADTLRWHREAWQFMGEHGPLPLLFTQDGGRVEHELVEAGDEQGEIRLTLTEPTHESVNELTGLLRAWVGQVRDVEHAQRMGLKELIEYLPRFAGDA